MKKLILVLALCFPIFQSFAAKVDTLQVASPSMGKTYKAAVVLPNSYAKGKASYPVIYLLHGAYGGFSDWLKKTPNPNTVKDLADQYNIIFVLPEGEKFSFYLDSPVSKESQFETFITVEVVAKVDSSYRTIANKKGRAISGLSMGGHGALYLSGRHPDLYAAAGSMSGALDMGGMPDRDGGLDNANKLMAPVFGAQGASKETYQSFAVMNMIGKLKANQLPLIIDCGVSDFLIESNKELHRRLVYYQVPHDYIERPGAHTWDYWENALPYQVLYFSKIFKTNGVMVSN
jgi:putative tributyrin esterase